MALSEEITPTPEEKKTIKNEYDFRRELLTALEEEFSSNNEVKDAENYRQHILHALGQEFDQDDIKQTNNFRAKVVEGVKELVTGGGGGESSFSVAKGVITNGTASDKQIQIAYIKNTETIPRPLASLATLPKNSTVTLDVVLYEGFETVYIGAGWTTQLTGNITRDDNKVTITGDFTMSIS